MLLSLARESRYLHGVRADDEHWSDAWNFSLTGSRSSIGVMNLASGWPTPYNVDLEVLGGPPDAWPPMALSGFMVTLRLGAIIRAGGRVGWGVPPYPTRWATDAAQARIMKNADRELALEGARRAQASNAPSRLCCLWLAEHSLDGRNWVQRMIGPRSFVMSVRVTIELASTRCDARWLDQVHQDPSDAEAASGYWSGEACDKSPLWEYVLEGQITAAEDDDLDRLREFIRTQGPPGDLLGPPK